MIIESPKPYTIKSEDERHHLESYLQDLQDENHRLVSRINELEDKVERAYYLSKPQSQSLDKPISTDEKAAHIRSIISVSHDTLQLQKNTHLSEIQAYNKLKQWLVKYNTINPLVSQNKSSSAKNNNTTHSTSIPEMLKTVEELVLEEQELSKIIKNDKVMMGVKANLVRVRQAADDKLLTLVRKDSESILFNIAELNRAVGYVMQPTVLKKIIFDTFKGLVSLDPRGQRVSLETFAKSRDDKRITLSIEHNYFNLSTDAFAFLNCFAQTLDTVKQIQDEILAEVKRPQLIKELQINRKFFMDEISEQLSPLFYILEPVLKELLKKTLPNSKFSDNNPAQQGVSDEESNSRVAELLVTLKHSLSSVEASRMQKSVENISDILISDKEQNRGFENFQTVLFFLEECEQTKKNEYINLATYIVKVLIDNLQAKDYDYDHIQRLLRIRQKLKQTLHSIFN